MSPRPQLSQAPAYYQLRIDGHLDDRWSIWFDGLVLTRDTDGTTSLTGPVADQAHLHGLLSKVRDLGVTLISVEPTSPPEPHRPAAGTRAGGPVSRPTARYPSVADSC